MLGARLLCLVAVAAALATGLPPASAGRAAIAAVPPTRPNILLVSIDSLRRDHVHAYGYPRETTPALDRLARDGVLFEQAVSSSSWTLPAHMSLFTAMPPRQHGVTKAHLQLAREIPTLPRVLQDAGYATAGFVSCPLLAGGVGFAQGFDHYDDHSVPQNRRHAADRGVTSPTLLAITSDWLATWDRAGRIRPFFVFLHLWDVHYDYAPPPPYDRMFDPDYDGAVTGDGFMANPDVHAGMDARDLAHVVALYDGEIRYTDDHLGRLLDRLAAIGVLDDTIVAVTSDHGDEFFEHGGKGHGLTVYDELVRVPLVVRWPRRIGPGMRVREQVRHVDVAPTLLGLAGVAPPPGFGTGGRFGDSLRERDLTPWLTAPRSPAPFPELVAIPESQMIFGYGTGAVRTPERKLVEYADPSRPRQLFDLASDPGETRDQAAERPDTADRFSRLRAGVGRALRDWAPPSEARQLDAETADRLRAMGYLE
jgi:arylsulfatase A-like enzyme